MQKVQILLAIGSRREEIGFFRRNGDNDSIEINFSERRAIRSKAKETGAIIIQGNEIITPAGERLSSTIDKQQIMAAAAAVTTRTKTRTTTSAEATAATFAKTSAGAGAAAAASSSPLAEEDVRRQHRRSEMRQDDDQDESNIESSYYSLLRNRRFQAL